MTLSLCAQQRVTLEGPRRNSQQGPVSRPPGIKAGNILPLMASDSRLNHTGVLREVIGAKEGCSTGSTNRTEQKETEFKNVRVRYYVQLPSMSCAGENWIRQDPVLNLVVRQVFLWQASFFYSTGIIIFFWN